MKLRILTRKALVSAAAVKSTSEANALADFVHNVPLVRTKLLSIGAFWHSFSFLYTILQCQRQFLTYVNRVYIYCLLLLFTDSC